MGGAPGKRMRLGTKSCAECRRRKVRCIFPPGQDRCDACQAHGNSCVPQEKQQTGAAAEDVDDVATLKRRLDELESLMRELPASAVPTRSRGIHGASEGLTDGSTLASSSPSVSTGRSPPATASTYLDDSGRPAFQSLINTSQINPTFQNSPLISLFNESSIFDTTTYTTPAPIPPSSASRLRQCLAQFASFLPQPAKVVELFQGTEKYWLIWPPYYYGPGDTDRLAPGQVALAEMQFHSALVSGHAGQTAKAILFLALCIQQTPKHMIHATLPPSIRQQELVDFYMETAQTLLQLDTDAGGGSLDVVEAMNMLYKLCVNMGRPQRGWYWNRQAITAAVSCGLPSKATRAGDRGAVAWSMAWRAERYMAMTLGLPSCTSPSHPGTTCLPDEDPVMRILHFIAVACGQVIDRDQTHGTATGGNYASTIQISEDIEDAKRRLFPAGWWDEPLPLDLDEAAGWHRQSCKILLLATLTLVHLPYMMRAGSDARYTHSWDAAMGAARGVCVAYRDLRRWPRGGSDLCQVMDFRAFSSALVLVVGRWTPRSPGDDGHAMLEEDAELVREVALCLRQTATLLDCRVAEQAVRALDALDAAGRGVYMADDDYEVVIPYFGQVRISKTLGGGQQDRSRGLPEKPDAAAVGDGAYGSMVEFATSDFLVDFPVDFGEMAAPELCCDWAELGLGYSGTTDWSHSFTYGPFYQGDAV